MPADRTPRMTTWRTTFDRSVQCRMLMAALSTVTIKTMGKIIAEGGPDTRRGGEVSQEPRRAAAGIRVTRGIGDTNPMSPRMTGIGHASCRAPFRDSQCTKKRGRHLAMPPLKERNDQRRRLPPGVLGDVAAEVLDGIDQELGDVAGVVDEAVRAPSCSTGS